MSGPAGSSQWMYKSGADYDIPYSCRFDQATDACYLSKTYGSDGNRRTWTFSGWFKRGTKRNRGLTEGWSNNHIFSPLAGGHGSQNECQIMIIEHGYLQIQDSAGVSGYMRHKTGAAFFDVANWYHLVVACDTTQATAANRFKVYVNGVEQTQFLSEEHQTQNNYTGWGAATLHTLGSYATTRTAANSWKGYLAECHFLDGVAVTANSFGEFGDYGEWKPIEYNVADGAYGTNGFYLNFSNASDLGEDFSGNNNDYATVSGTALDSPAQSLDSPTNNFCTLDPMRTSLQGTSDQLNYGNLELHVNNGGVTIMSAGTFAVTSGKWYFEAIANTVYTGGGGAYTQPEIGLIGVTDEVTDGNGTNNARTVVYKTSYDYEGVTDNLSGATFATYTEGDIIGVAYNADDDEITFYKNNAAQTTTSLQATDSQGMQPLIMNHYGNVSQWVANFGQDSSFSGHKSSGSAAASDSGGYGDFYYTPPTGFLALCAKNLPEPAVIPSEHFDIALYIGNGSTQNITSLGFQPDFTWIKNRHTADQHQLFDAVRGVTKTMSSAETTLETTNDDTLTHFLSNGFTTGDDVVTNTSGEYYVAWNWKVNGSGSSNTNGSINTTSTSVNTDAGFSISTWTGNATSGATIGHGLSKAPDLIISKQRSGASNWLVYHSALGPTYHLSMEVTGPKYTGTNIWNDTAPTATVFSVGNNAGVNGNTETYVTYCFHNVDGYSKFGSYEGNAGGGYYGQDGPFINLGFRPRFIMIKTVDDTDAWVMYDSERGWRLNANRRNYLISADVESAETEHGAVKTYADFFSNGVKIRDDDNLVNKNGDTYIYIAFAEIPFKYANGGFHTQGYHADNNPP